MREDSCFKLESIEFCKKEDRIRVNILRKQQKNTSKNPDTIDIMTYSKKSFGDVASKIEQNTGEKIVYRGLSSSRYYRSIRRKLCLSLKALTAEFKQEDMIFATLVPLKGWHINGGDLKNVDPKNLLERFRQQLNRKGLTGCSGILIARLHGEYDPSRDTYQLHIHLLATGDVVNVVEKLRSLPVYRPSSHYERDFIKRPILKQKVRHLLRQGFYHLGQAFWPSKPTFGHGERHYRNRRRQRIPDQRFAQFLVWLDSCQNQSMTLLHGCRYQNDLLRRVDR